MARALINAPTRASRGQVIEIKTLISHAMETGYRPDYTGKLVPRDIINRFVCTYNGVEVFRADLHPAIAATGHPVLPGPGVPVAGNGAALSVSDVTSFTRSGAVTLGGPGTSVAVSVPGGLSSSSHVLATMQTNTGVIAVRAAVPNPATGKVTIYLTGTAPKGAKIAWFVFG